jgi:hypothetical protein
MVKVEDMYLDGTFYKRLVVNGEGKSLPNTNAHVRVFYRLEAGEERRVVMNNFESPDGPFEFIMDGDTVPSLWIHCLRQMKEGDLVRVDCNLMGLNTSNLCDGLDPAYNFEPTEELSAVFTI